MQLVMKSYRGLSVLMGVNGDRIMSGLLVLSALALAAFLGAELLQPRY